MNKHYKYSPIKNSDELLDAATYVIGEMKALSKQLLGEELPVASVKIFAHYTEEYEELKKILHSLGELEFETYTSMYVKLHRPIAINNQAVNLLGIRIPDPYRAQVGCGDFIISENYASFEKKHITDDDPTRLIRKAVGHKLSMIELWHPDSDVLGYVLAPKSKWFK